MLLTGFHLTVSLWECFGESVDCGPLTDPDLTQELNKHGHQAVSKFLQVQKTGYDLA